MGTSNHHCKTLMPLITSVEHPIPAIPVSAAERYIRTVPEPPPPASSNVPNCPLLLSLALPVDSDLNHSLAWLLPGTASFCHWGAGKIELWILRVLNSFGSTSSSLPQLRYILDIASCNLESFFPRP